MIRIKAMKRDKGGAAALARALYGELKRQGYRCAVSVGGEVWTSASFSEVQDLAYHIADLNPGRYSTTDLLYAEERQPARKPITFAEFCTAIAEAMGGHVTTSRNYDARISRDGRQICWLDGNDEPGSKLADISDLVDDQGRSTTRCYLCDDNDGQYYVWDNLCQEYDDREGQILLYHGKSLKIALRKALAYNPARDSKKYPIWS